MADNDRKQEVLNKKASQNARSSLSPKSQDPASGSSLKDRPSQKQGLSKDVHDEHIERDANNLEPKDPRNVKGDRDLNASDVRGLMDRERPAYPHDDPYHDRDPRYQRSRDYPEDFAERDHRDSYPNPNYRSQRPYYDDRDDCYGDRAAYAREHHRRYEERSARYAPDHYEAGDHNRGDCYRDDDYRGYPSRESYRNYPDYQDHRQKGYPYPEQRLSRATGDARDIRDSRAQRPYPSEGEHGQDLAYYPSQGRAQDYYDYRRSPFYADYQDPEYRDRERRSNTPDRLRSAVDDHVLDQDYDGQDRGKSLRNDLNDRSLLGDHRDRSVYDEQDRYEQGRPFRRDQSYDHPSYGRGQGQEPFADQRIDQRYDDFEDAEDRNLSSRMVRRDRFIHDEQGQYDRLDPRDLPRHGVRPNDPIFDQRARDVRNLEGLERGGYAGRRGYDDYDRYPEYQRRDSYYDRDDDYYQDPRYAGERRADGFANTAFNERPRRGEAPLGNSDVEGMRGGVHPNSRFDRNLDQYHSDVPDAKAGLRQAEASVAGAGAGSASGERNGSSSVTTGTGAGDGNHVAATPVASGSQPNALRPDAVVQVVKSKVKSDAPIDVSAYCVKTKVPPKCVDLHLTYNYRSQPHILMAAYDVISHNREVIRRPLQANRHDIDFMQMVPLLEPSDNILAAAKVKNQIIETFKEKSVLHSASASRQHLVESKSGLRVTSAKDLFDERLSSQTEPPLLTMKPVLVHMANDKSEAKFVVSTIRDIYRIDTQASIAVLYRSHYAVTKVEDELIQSEIPYSVVGSVSFFERKEIQDAMSYMRLRVNPDDDLALRRVINVPSRRFGAKRMELLENLARKDRCSLFQALIRNHDNEHLYGRNTVASFVDMIVELNEKPLTNPARDFELLMAKSGYEEWLKEQGEDERLNNLAELKQLVVKFEGRQGENVNLADFLYSIMLLTDADEANRNLKEVQLMTVHCSKGLEFDYVFIVGTNEAIFPSIKSVSANNIEEERRLMYVAMTRARKQLIMTEAGGSVYVYVPNPLFSGKTEAFPFERLPSRFLTEMKEPHYEELGAHILEAKNAKDRNLKKLRPQDVGAQPYKDAFNAMHRNDSLEDAMAAAQNRGFKFPVGAVIKHSTFGEGVIEACHDGLGEYEIFFYNLNRRRRITATVGNSKFVLVKGPNDSEAVAALAKARETYQADKEAQEQQERQHAADLKAIKSKISHIKGPKDSNKPDGQDAFGQGKSHQADLKDLLRNKLAGTDGKDSGNALAVFTQDQYIRTTQGSIAGASKDGVLGQLDQPEQVEPARGFYTAEDIPNLPFDFDDESALSLDNQREPESQSENQDKRDKDTRDKD